MGQKKISNLHIVTDIKSTVKMLKICIWFCLLTLGWTRPTPLRDKTSYSNYEYIKRLITGDSGSEDDNGAIRRSSVCKKDKCSCDKVPLDKDFKACLGVGGKRCGCCCHDCCHDCCHGCCHGHDCCGCCHCGHGGSNCCHCCCNNGGDCCCNNRCHDCCCNGGNNCCCNDCCC